VSTNRYWLGMSTSRCIKKACGHEAIDTRRLVRVSWACVDQQVILTLQVLMALQVLMGKQLCR
jgi:hypothetical protein